MRDFDKPRGKGAVLGVSLFLAAGGQAGDGGAVIIAVTIQDFRLLAAIVLGRNLPHHFKGFFIRLRAGVGIINAIQTWHFADQAFGKFGTRNGAFRPCKIAKFDQLVAHGIGDFRPSIADVNRPDTAGHSIKMFLAGDIPNPHAFAFDDDLGVNRFKGFMLCQMVPNMRAVCLDHCGCIVREIKCSHRKPRITVGGGAFEAPLFDHLIIFWIRFIRQVFWGCRYSAAW